MRFVVCGSIARQAQKFPCTSTAIIMPSALRGENGSNPSVFLAIISSGLICYGLAIIDIFVGSYGDNYRYVRNGSSIVSVLSVSDIQLLRGCARTLDGIRYMMDMYIQLQRDNNVRLAAECS